MPRYFLDTNVCIDLLRGKARGRRLPAYTACDLSAVVAAELWTGAAKSADAVTARKTVAAFVALFTIVPFDAVAAESYGEVRARLERQGTPIDVVDERALARRTMLKKSPSSVPNRGFPCRLPGGMSGAVQRPRPRVAHGGARRSRGGSGGSCRAGGRARSGKVRSGQIELVAHAVVPDAQTKFRPPL